MARYSRVCARRCYCAHSRFTNQFRHSVRPSHRSAARLHLLVLARLLPVMSAQEQSLKAKMAQLKAKKEAEAKAAAAAAAGGGTAAGGPNGVPAAFKAMMLPLGAGSAPPRPIGHPALAAPVAAARKPGAATGATAQSSGPKPIPRPSSGPKPLPVPPRPGAGVASAGAAGSVARAAGAVGAAAASPSVKHAGSSLGLSVTPTPAPPAAAVPKRRILRKPDADSIDSSAAAATAAGAAAVAAKAVPSIAAASAGGAPLNFISKPSTAPVVGLKRKKQSGPAQGPVEVCSRDACTRLAVLCFCSALCSQRRAMVFYCACVDFSWS
jgi:hypothetical protein